MSNITKIKENNVEIFSQSVPITGIHAKFIPKAPITGVIIRKISGADYTSASLCTSTTTNFDDFTIFNYANIHASLAVDTPYIENTPFLICGILFVTASPGVYEVEYSY